MRHVDRNELHASFLQAEQEVRIAAQSVELGDDELGVEGAACVERFGQRWAVIVTLAALDLDVLLAQRPVASVQPGFDGGALRFETEAALALTLGRDAKVGDEFPVMFGHATMTITKVTVFVKIPSPAFAAIP